MAGRVTGHGLSSNVGPEGREAMDRLKRLIATTALALASSAAFAADPTHGAISRCFFVYAQIFETAKKLDNAPVLIYGQKRLAWVGGYMQAQQNNPKFKSVFEGNLKGNKQAGVAIEARLTGAIRSGDAQEYIAVMNIARECDKQLGLPTNDIPPP